jgi:hypothetical protein
MEDTPKDETEPGTEQPASTPASKPPAPTEKPTPAPAPKEDGESYEDNWYQVLKRRAKDVPADDEATEE